MKKNTQPKIDKLVNFAEGAIKWSELMIALLLFLLTLAGVIVLGQYLVSNIGHISEHFHKDFELILSNILLLIVALELALLLIKHRLESIVEIMFFVIARKLAVHTQDIYEMAIGVIALAALFAIRKYLMICKDCRKLGHDMKY